jgi:hypothetical protein
MFIYNYNLGTNHTFSYIQISKHQKQYKHEQSLRKHTDTKKNQHDWLCLNIASKVFWYLLLMLGVPSRWNDWFKHIIWVHKSLYNTLELGSLE